MLSRTILTLILATSVASEETVNGPELYGVEEPAVVEAPEATDLNKVKNEYFKFVAEYGKQYASKEHMDERFAIFKDNYYKIQNHNDHIDEEGRSPPFTMGVNQFSDLTEEEFMADRFGGAKIPERLKQKRLESARKRAIG